MSKNRFGIKPGKTFNKIVSVVIAIFIWAYVIAEVNPVTQQTMVGIPVQLYNTQSITDRGLAIAGEQTFTVNVLLEGKRRDMVQTTAEDVIATADLIGFGEGESSVRVGVAVPEGMTIVEISPAKIKVNIEKLVTQEKPVVLEFSGDVEIGNEAGQIKLNPETIEVTGAESSVNSVSSVKAFVDVEDLDENLKTIKVKAVPVDVTGAKVENVQTSLEDIDVTGRLLSTKEVKLQVEITGRLNPLYEVKFIDVPGTIKIKGEAAVLAGITSIQAEAIDISSLTITRQLPVTPIFPEGIEAAEGSEALMVEIGVQELASRAFTFTGNQIEVRGLADNLTADVKVESVVVKASGSKEIVEGLLKEDTKVFVNLTDTAEGVGNFTIEMSCDKQIDNLQSDPAEVYVIISTR